LEPEESPGGGPPHPGPAANLAIWSVVRTLLDTIRVQVWMHLSTNAVSAA
jgi:hypothetical protein